MIRRGTELSVKAIGKGCKARRRMAVHDQEERYHCVIGIRELIGHAAADLALESRAVNSVKNDTEECIRPIENAPTTRPLL